jgi:DNA-binding CsgD family transcriptional regulator
MLRARLGVTFPRPTLRRIADASGSNPFFALELARAVSRKGREVDIGEPLPVPTGLHDLVADRLARLPDGTREALLLAALASEPTVEIIRAALAGDPWKRLRPAAEADAIEFDGARIRFTHPLLASATEAGVDAGRRRDAHRRLAELVVEPEERARHLALAADAPDEAVAAAVELGAARALARGAPDVAAMLAETAVRLTPPRQTSARRRRALRAIDNHFQSGTLERSANLLETLARASPPGPARAEALARLAFVHFLQGRGARVAIRELETALVDAGDDRPLQARIERTLAWMHQAAGDVGTAEEHARTAVDLAEVAREPSSLAGALSTLAFVKFLAGCGIDATSIDRAISLEPDGLPAMERAGWVLGMLLEWSGDHERARATLDALLREGVERGADVGVPFALTHAARVALRAGDWARARDAATEAMEYTLQMGVEDEHAFALATAAIVEAHLGGVDRARELVRDGLALAERLENESACFELLGASGFLDLSLGDAESAERVLGPLVDAVASAGFGEPAVFRIDGDAIEALITLGRLEEAEAALGRLVAHARAVPSPWIVAVVARCEGMLEAARGDTHGAVATLIDAHEKATRLAEPFELGRTLLTLGTAQRRAKRWRDARQSLEVAKRTFERVRARLWVKRAQEELQRVPGRPPRGAQLTPTERRVAELVAQGRANKEVAAALFVTVKAVEANLSRVYAKLGVRSRTELAQRLAATTEPKL